MDEGPNTIERTSRSVIENKLLTALQEGDCVAALFTKQDLEALISALAIAETFKTQNTPKWNEMRLSFEQLHKEAFPATTERTKNK